MRWQFRIDLRPAGKHDDDVPSPQEMKHVMPERYTLFPGCRGLLFVGAFLLMSGNQPAGADEPDYTIEEITTRLKEWESKIQTLRVHTKTVCDPYAKMAVTAGLTGVKRIAYNDWIWTKAGPYRHHRWVTYNGRPWMRSLDACDAVRAWRASYENGHNESDPTDVKFSAINPNGQSSPTPLYRLWGRLSLLTSTSNVWIGEPNFWIGEANVWIGEAIKRGELEFVGVDEFDGRQCVLMRRTVGLHRPDGPLQENFWLDPAHGFLPVQIEIPRFSKYDVKEFFEPEPGFFFPKRGQFLHRIEDVVEQAEEWEITAVELNQELPAALWVPPVVHKEEPDLAEKTAAKGQAVRLMAWHYALRMTGLDFWLDGGFLAITVIVFVGVLVLWLFKKHKRRAPPAPPPPGPVPVER